MAARLKKSVSKTARKASGKALSAYRTKRDFTITGEPPPAVAKSKAEPIFVIQQHAATRLHWDFRLEAEGVLKSWAVTKEPTLDPAVRRLAVHVEDHPLAYGSFHGEIPAGQYGAGHVDIWDHGTFTPKPGMGVMRGLELGHVEVNLHGEKLKGMFALIRMGEAGKEGGPKENWLLLKMKDDHARPGTAPADRASYRPKKGAKKEVKSFEADGSAKAHSSVAGESATPRAVEFTHVDKVMFPQAKLTKADLIRYYVEIAPHLVPHLKDRPITLERLPDGLSGPDAPRFWQKNTPSYYPAWIPRATETIDGGKKVAYTLVNDEHVLAYLVNQGAVTFHPFLSRVPHLDRPDFVVFDLDPGPVPFGEVVKIAKTLHAALRERKIEAFVKTSGKSGLHVTVLWTGPGETFDAARAWAMEVSADLVARLPKLATTERSKAVRGEKVYVDVLQNGPGKHVVPAYVVRAVPAATVSCPLDWDELTAKLTPSKFTTAVVLKRVQKIDPALPLLASKELV